MDFISSMLQDLLNILFSFTGDLGISIVIITLLVKICLMPLSLKQKLAIKNQQDLAKKVEVIKEKYKHNNKRLEAELLKHSKESMKGMFGCFTILVQMPIVYALYNTFLNMPYVASSVIIPWVSNLNVSDNLFIVPCIYALTMLMPSLINYVPYFRSTTKAIFNKQMLISTIIMSFLLTAKTPVALGIYFITSSLYSFIEDICFRIYIKKKEKLIIN